MRKGSGAREPVSLTPWLAGILALLAGVAAWAQLAVRPEDPLGLSIRQPRIRVIHSDRPDVPGTSMQLQQADPWLAYQMGSSYFFREWNRQDQVFQGFPPWARELGGSTTSCGMCHAMPFRTAGAGGTTLKPLGYGRQTPHLFGTGLLETIGIQLRQQILAAYDANRNGFLDVPAEVRGQRVVIEASPGFKVDFGSLEDLDGNGRPDLNRAIVIHLVDSQGRPFRREDTTREPRLDDPGVAGFDLSVGIYGATMSEHQYPALRVFSLTVLVGVMGILPDDPTSVQNQGLGRDRRAGDVWAETSNAGAPQPYLPVLANIPKDLVTDARVSEGEADLLEWFLLNHPGPGVGAQDERTRRGRALLHQMGCTSCHVPDWVIHPADEATGLPGDRRFFDLQVRHNPRTDRLEGRLRSLTRKVVQPDGSILQVPRREKFTVEGVYSDLLHHDVGEQFYEYVRHPDGATTARKRYRTAPLWGVGSTPPYGHDGRSATLDDVIRRHGGAAERSTRSYVQAPVEDRDALLDFLRSLVLYQPDILPTDVDGDGKIDERHWVSGREVGPERLRPELLFRVPPHYRGWTRRTAGDRFFSYEMLNLAEAYGARLQALADSDGDGIPDLAESPRPESAPPQRAPARPVTEVSSGNR